MRREAQSECKGGCGRLIPYAGRGRPRVWCGKCSKDVTRKTAKRRAPRRAIADDFGAVEFYKRCTRCRGWKVLGIENFTVRKRDRVTGRVVEWQAECRPCINARRRREWAERDPESKLARMRRQYISLKNDPERWERERARKRERMRVIRANWTPEQREAYNARKREAWARRMAVPGVREWRAEGRRLIARMRAEEEGREIVSRAAMNGYKPAAGNAPSGHVEPLALWLDVVLQEDHRDFSDLAEMAGVAERALWRVRHREYASVTISMADRLVWSYNRAVKLPSGEEIGGMLEARCRAMPGNGERILRYMDLAERVAHLADAVVDHVDDLYPVA